MIYDLRFKNLFFGVLIFFLSFGWLTLFFAAIGLFYTGTIVLSILAGTILTFLFLPKISQNIDIKAGKIFYFVILISLIISFSTCCFSTPTVFGGRDQGAIATAAIYLSKNHHIKADNPVTQDLFQKYGPGRALNFPGFDYTKDGKLISRFPLVYTSYLAAAYNFFGLKGIQYANLLPLFFFFVIFWLILREFFNQKISLLSFLLAATFFPFLWFAKYTLTEIFTLFLVWAGIYFLIRFRRDPIPSLGIGSLFLFALSALTRIEGIIFFLLAAAYILFLQKKKMIPTPKNFKKYLFISTLLLFCLYVSLNYPTLFDSAKNFAKDFLPDSTKESMPSVGLYSYLMRIFLIYNILPYLILGLAGIVWLAVIFKKNWAKSEFLPILITFPSFLYLASPQITLDDPWLFRRFVFAVLPALIFYAIYFLNRFFYHKIFLYIALIALVAANIAVSQRFFTLSENKDLLPQVEKISQKFEPKDLILVDRLATGSGYSLLSEPLSTISNLQAVYFFNSEDLSYIDQSKYKNIYLIAPFFPENKNYWYAKLTREKTPQSLEIIKNNFLKPSKEKWHLAQNIEAEILVGIWKIK